MSRSPTKSLILLASQRIAAVVGGLVLAVGMFLLLPLLESITSTSRDDMIVQSVNTANVPPPPAPPVEEEEKKDEEPPPEPEPPKLADEAPPLDLSMLELALNPGMGGGVGGDFAVQLPVSAASASGGSEGGVAIYQVSPQMSAQLKKIAPGTVYIVFVVDQRGRVENPVVQSASDPAFEAPALAAVKQWKFEPGKRNGEPVRFRMRVPITFPKGK
jgi:protein TonB